MRISTKFTAVVLIVFLVVGSIATLTAVRLRDLAKTSVESEARELANTLAAMIAYQIPETRNEGAEKLQRIIDFIGMRQQRDVEIVDHNLINIADIAHQDISKPLPPGLRRDLIARTLRDGTPRFVVEGDQVVAAPMRQVVVPVPGKGGGIAAALVYEYSPLYDALFARAEESLQDIAIAALGGLLVALGSVAFFARRIAGPLAELRTAAVLLSQGHRDVTVRVAAHDEIGELATVFNEMSAALLASEARLSRLGQFDTLTGLANRNLFMDRLRLALVDATRRPENVVVAFVDLDGFKLVNDSLGHDSGDQLLKTVAERLGRHVRATDTVARFGGDEFVILLRHQFHDGHAAAETAIANHMRVLVELVGTPTIIGEKEVRVGCSIGIAVHPRDGVDATTLLKHADSAMYRAKELGKDGFQFFTADLQDSANKQLTLAASLRRALQQNEFELHYQPQISVKSGKVVGIEALLRWRHPTLGLLGPAHFIAFAEDTGLIIQIGEWVLNEACRQNKRWHDAGVCAVAVAVNVSAKQCAHPELEAVVRNALRTSGLAPRWLELELTESISIANPDQSVPMMTRMKRIGVKLSIDDFGTGYSNLGYLRQFPIDRLKLDLSFVKEITTDPTSMAIAKSIISLSHSMGVEVVAEGVETEGQLAALTTHGCDVVQGYLFSRPVPVESLESWCGEAHDFMVGTRARSTSPAILLLDDDALLLQFWELQLRKEGYIVHGTTDPFRAFELLARHDVAVVICDERMPVMNGVEFITRVRKMYPRAIRIMFSVYNDSVVTRDAINMGGVYKFIDKSSNPDELCNAIGEAYSKYLK